MADSNVCYLSDKNSLNLKKHGLDFSLAIEVFSDPYAVEQLINREHREERYQIVGKITNEELIIFVVFTKRDKKRRIISARRASKKERLIYEN